jgi:hypothetical protein
MTTVLAWASGCGDASVGTFVRLSFSGTVSQAAPIQTIAVDLQLGTRLTSTTFQASSQAGIKLPIDAILEIGSGEGRLAVSARALAANGDLLGTGVGSGTVVRDKTVDVPVLFGAGLGDASVDGAGVDGPAIDLPALDATGRDASALDGAVDLGNVRVDADLDLPATGGISGTGGVGAGGAGGGRMDSGNDGASADSSSGTGGSGGVGSDVSTAGYRLTATPASLDFDAVVPGGTSPARTVTIVNEGDAPTPALIVSIPTVKGFTVSSDSCAGAVLAPQGTCRVSVTFSPATTGIMQAEGSVAPAGGPGARFQLTGAGAGTKPELLLTPSVADFKLVDVGSSSSIDFTLRNIGTADAGTVTVQTSVSPSFRIENDRCTKTVLVGQGQCLFTVVFAPAAYGPASVTVTAQSSLGLTVSAKGTGTGRDYVTVSVLFAGGGSGSVTGPGMSCATGAGPCSINVPRVDPSAVFTMSAIASTGSSFSGWSGAGCAGTGACSVGLTSPPTVTATFVVATTPTLTVTKTGNGDGLVASDPLGINCGTACSMSVSPSQIVTLTATANPGSTFAGWAGGGCSGVGACTVTVTSATTVTATFALNTYTVTVSKVGTGVGTIKSSPAGIACPGTCSTTFNYGDKVTLTAEPGAHSTFSGWDSTECTGTGECTFLVTAATTLTAKFTMDRYTLTVKTDGTGRGSVTSDPIGITCGTDCTQVFDYGTKILLTVSSGSGSTFVGWVGDACSGTGDCTMLLTGDTTVGAVFNATVTCSTLATAKGCLYTTKYDLGVIDYKTCPDDCAATLQKKAIASGCWFVDSTDHCWCTDGTIVTGGSLWGGTCK